MMMFFSEETMLNIASFNAGVKIYQDSEPNYEKMDKYKNISGDKIINLAKLTINRNKLN